MTTVTLIQIIIFHHNFNPIQKLICYNLYEDAEEFCYAGIKLCNKHLLQIKIKSLSTKSKQLEVLKEFLLDVINYNDDFVCIIKKCFTNYDHVSACIFCM
jgi:hypothetical protein